MTADTEYWACRVCRSINSRRSNRCYSCHTPRDVAAVAPTELPTIGAAPPVVHSGAYKSSEMRAVMVTVVTITFVLGALASSYLLWQAGSLRAAGERAAANELFGSTLPYLALIPLLGGLALLTYAAWISRVVSNLPAIDAGYSRVSATMAFIEPLIPGFNLYALPARLGEVLRKLDEKGNGLPLLGLSFILVVIPPAVGAIFLRVVGSASRYRPGLQSNPLPDEFFLTAGFTLFMAVVVEAMGLLIGLYIVWKVEHLARTRAEAKSRNGPAQRARR